MCLSLTAAAIASGGASAQTDQANSPSIKPESSAEGEGSLYPTPAIDSPLGVALGPARYVLSDTGLNADFRRRVAKAVAVHPLLRSERTTASRSRAALDAEKAALYPQLTANINGDYVLSREFGTDTDNVVEALRPSGQANAGLTVSQLLFDGGAAFARIRSARARERETKLNIDNRANEIALAALASYHDVLAYQAIGALSGEFVRRHEKLVEDLRERARRGTGARADVERAAARLANARARVLQFEESGRLADIRYQEFFATSPEKLMRPAFGALAVGSRDEAVAAALARHPSLGAAYARMDQAEALLRAEKARRRPELRASVNAVKFDLGESDDYDVRAGLTLNYDLYAGGARRAGIAEARAAARQNEYDKDAVALGLARDAATAYERQEITKARLDALQDAVVAQYKARDLVVERFRVARGDLLDLLQAENDWFEAGVAYLIASAGYDLAVYQMMAFTGDLQRLFSFDAAF
ncbi:MAG: TolC family protein, partial [Pseudomonadota bacterium]